MNLAEYFKSKLMKQIEFCKKHQLPPQTIHRVKYGYDMRLSTAKRIVEATNGEVTYEDLANNLKPTKHPEKIVDLRQLKLNY